MTVMARTLATFAQMKLPTSRRRRTTAHGLNLAEHHGEIAQKLRQENGPAAFAEESLPAVNT
jgi:hypothetical protein